MIKTKIKKAIALTGIVVLSAVTIGSTALAATIGSVTNTVTTTDVVWDNLFPGTATGTTTVIVTAQVLPTLNMSVSTGAIDLGVLTAGIESTGSVDIEVGTNAANGVTVTARSGSGGLTNTSDNALQINNSTVDGIAESYKFASTLGTPDSTITGFLSTPLGVLEVSDNTTEHIVYSSNKPEQTDNTVADVAFVVSTTSNAQTPAGNYQDIITFTVTGNF